MSALAKVREKFGNLPAGTDKADKSPSVSSVSASREESQFSRARDWGHANGSLAFGPPHADSRFPRLAAINLVRRIRAMALRWQYTADDLAYALEDAQARSETWLACCEWDEQLHDKARRAGMRWPH